MCMPRLNKILPMIVALALPASGIAQTVPEPDTAESAADSCPTRSVLLNFDVYRFGELESQAPMWRFQDDAAFFFAAGMTIDADGAPNAYNPENTGLDDISNAGQPGHWDGLLEDENGNPLVQGPQDPFPGYYISCTALADRTKQRFDPTKFVDASRIPYIALPDDLARQSGARLGDLAAVINLHTGKLSYAIFADIGSFGEGSIALADNLGIRSDARDGGTWGGLLYVVFPGSGDGQPKSVEEINQQAEALFQTWGGIEQVRSCALNHSDNLAAWLGWNRRLVSARPSPIGSLDLPERNATSN
jgi:Fungal chitosanase of glycosyl hydrolase group 75